MKKSCFRKLSKPLLIFILVFLSTKFSYCKLIDEDETTYDYERGERVVEGQHFAISEDRKVEKFGQYMEPEGLDKYMKRKFDKIFSIQEAISNRLSTIESRVSDLEAYLKQIQQGIESLKNQKMVETE